MKIIEDLRRDRQFQIALGATLVLLLVVLIIFGSNAAYMESGQGYYFMAICAGLGLLFWGMKAFRFVIIIPAILVIVCALTISVLKFEWRKAYIEKAEAGEPFLFEEYIDGYPTLEQYIKASFFGGENWIGFTRICAEPAEAGLSYPPLCSDLQQIEAEFGLDMKAIVQKHYIKMKRTAQRISSGRLKDKKRYQQCIDSGQCVIVPLLPAGVDPDRLSGNDYGEIRRAFWSLIDDEKMNNTVCNQMKLCRILVEMKALKESSF
jgi:uncharacterized membrane protein